MNQDKKENSYQLTKVGIVILVVTLVLSILCTTFGVIILAGNNESNSGSDKTSGSNDNNNNNSNSDKTSGSNDNNNNNSNDDDSDTSTYTVYEGTSKNLTVKSGRYYYFEFTPDSSENYIINIDGAYVTGVVTEYGKSVSYSVRTTTAYDYSYTASLTAGTTYTIKVYTESTSMYLYLY